MLDRCANEWNRTKNQKLNVPKEKEGTIKDSPKSGVTKKSQQSDLRQKEDASQCVMHKKWDSNAVPFWSHSTVLQLGGMAVRDRGGGEGGRGGGEEGRGGEGLRGCISQLRINQRVSKIFFMCTIYSKK